MAALVARRMYLTTGELVGVFRLGMVFLEPHGDIGCVEVYSEFSESANIIHISLMTGRSTYLNIPVLRYRSF